MNIFRFFYISVIMCSPFFAFGEKQDNTRVHDIHMAAHKSQLANVRPHLDKSVIRDFIVNDVQRENSYEGLSHEQESLVNDLLKEASTHIGKKYRSGAKGPTQFDCSGFSSYVFKQFGVALNSSSRAQYTQGEAIDLENLRKGDLVFFTSRGSGKNVGHVGIVTEADNEKGTFKFIHASIKGVTISEYAGYYQRTYIGARRVKL